MKPEAVMARSALSKSSRQRGAKSFIFDVRDNPGGLVSELVSLLDYLLPDGDLFVSVDKAGKETVQNPPTRYA